MKGRDGPVCAHVDTRPHEHDRIGDDKGVSIPVADRCHIQ